MPILLNVCILQIIKYFFIRQFVGREGHRRKRAHATLTIPVRRESRLSLPLTSTTCTFRVWRTVILTAFTSPTAQVAVNSVELSVPDEYSKEANTLRSLPLHNDIECNSQVLHSTTPIKPFSYSIFALLSPFCRGSCVGTPSGLFLWTLFSPDLNINSIINPYFSLHISFFV